MRPRLGRGGVFSSAVAKLPLVGALALLVALIPCGRALAQAGTVPTPDGRYRVGYGPAVTLIDAQTSRVLIGGTSFPVTVSTTLLSTVRMFPRAGGLDLRVTYSNVTQETRELGSIAIDGIRLPGDCVQWTFGQDTRRRTLPGYEWYNQNTYPLDWYSPVMVAGDSGNILGFQLLYPVSTYDHSVQLDWAGVPAASEAAGPPHWSLQVHLNSTLKPGETRRYTLAIRATGGDQSFLRTLTPYRDYFRAEFGPVKYKRDARAVEGEAAATVRSVGLENPQGWSPANLRPDVNGWSIWADQLLSRRAAGYRRVMLWTPSGIFEEGNPLNFPWAFMTPINDYPMAGATLGELRRVKGAGMEMGLWWGNSATLMHGWGRGATPERFDPNNPEHVRLAFDELDLAVGAGATMIGLDAFKLPSPRDMHQWILRLQARAPGVKFVTENAASDYLHNLCPTFHEALETQNSHVLADFLNPGHETWAAIAIPAAALAQNRPPTPAEMMAEAERVAALGYVPLCYGPWVLPEEIRAAESWRFTVPVDLRTPLVRPERRRAP